MTQVIIRPQFESTSLILSRRDIKHISTAVSRGNVVINEIKLSAMLKVLSFEIAYFSYTKRWQQAEKRTPNEIFNSI